jgi:BRCT domain type II-containing protein
MLADGFTKGLSKVPFVNHRKQLQGWWQPQSNIVYFVCDTFGTTGLPGHTFYLFSNTARTRGSVTFDQVNRTCLSGVCLFNTLTFRFSQWSCYQKALVNGQSVKTDHQSSKTDYLV